MTDEPTDDTAKSVSNSRTRGLTPFKPGYDPRRWIKGRSPKSPEQKEGEKILLAVIWEELSREFDTGSMKPLETPETVDALRLMVRTWIKKKPDEIAARIAGKVQDRLDVTSNGEKITEIGVKLIDYRTGITATETGSTKNSNAPGENQNTGDGA